MPTLIAGVDNLSLDIRKFDPSHEDIERICRFFALGHLQNYEKEKGIIVSHANFIVLVATSLGQYVIKFYPKDTAKTIAVEYAINRVLINHHFATPLMCAGRNGQPLMASNDLLVTCYDYINSVPAWQDIKALKTFYKINSAMLSLKNILSTTTKKIPFLKQERLLTTINTLIESSRTLASYDQKEMINASLQDTCREYQRHQTLFSRRILHNNTSLTNFLIDKKTVYTLDLSHIREDYVLSDLASLVISCIFFSTPARTIKSITHDYFSQHKIKPGHFPVLNTLIKTGLIKEYLKNIHRERSDEFSPYPLDIRRSYMSHLASRKKCITAVLKKMNDNPRFIV